MKTIACIVALSCTVFVSVVSAEVVVEQPVTVDQGVVFEAQSEAEMLYRNDEVQAKLTGNIKGGAVFGSEEFIENAELTVVPIPASLLMTALGFCLIGFRGLIRSKKHDS